MPLKTLQKLPSPDGYGLLIALRSEGSLVLNAREVFELCKMLPSMFPEHFQPRVSEEDIKTIAEEALKR